MIYPKSFPASENTSYLDEQIYLRLKELVDQGEELSVSFHHEVYVKTTEAFGKKRGIEDIITILEFLIFIPTKGLLLLQEDAHELIPAVLKRGYNFLREKWPSIPIYTAYSSAFSNSSLNFKDWLMQQFAGETISLTTEEQEHIEHHLKENNLYYTPYGRLSAFAFENFQGIKSSRLENLPTSANWIFLTGENGYGKTSLLRAIATALYTEIPIAEEKKGFSSLDEKNKKAKLRVLLQSPDDDEKNYYAYPRERLKKVYRNVVAYGPARLETYEQDEPSKTVVKNPILSIYRSSIPLRSIEYYLKLWKLHSDETIQEKFKQTIALLEQLLGAMGMQIEVTKSQRVFYLEEGKSAIQFNQLASGYRSLIAMVGDLIIRMFEAQPDVLNPVEFEGIVIIDELDLHWHPKWQQKIPQLLTDLFPKIQFIASTHSPIPLLGAPEGSVFLKVNRTAEKGIWVERLSQLEKEIHKLTPNIVLDSDIFDFDFFEGKSNEELEQIYVEDDYETVQKNKEIEERLKNVSVDIFPKDLFSNED